MRPLSRPRLALVAATITALAVAGTAAGASPQNTPLRVGDAIVDDHPDVAVTVTAPRRLLPSEVGPDSFAVVEAGAPAAVTEVTPLAASDLEVVLAIDTSGSMAGGAMPAAKAAAASFLDALPPDVDVAVLGFGAQPRPAAPFGATREELRAAIAELTPAGETALYDALGTAAGMLPDAEAATQQAIVLLSDGGDTASQAGLDQAERALADSGAVLHAVELVSAEADHEALVRLAGVTAGQVVPASDPEALAAVYRTLAEQLTSQYRVVYTSQANGSTNVEVALAGDPAAAARLTLELPEPPPAAPRAPQPPGSLVEPGWWASSPMLAASVAAVAMALLLVGLVFVLPREPRARLASRGGTGGAGEAGADSRRGTTFLAAFAERSSLLADRVLARLGVTARVNRALERAGVNLRPGEYLVVVGSAVFAGGAIGLALLGATGALLLGVGALVAGWLVPSVLTARRRARFEEQLPDVLQLLAGSLRVGHGLLQAVDTVAREAEPPARDEFQRLVLETRLGRDLGDSLHAMVDRLDNQDFAWVVQAIEINREVGGDLAEVLDTVAATIRERQQLRRHVKALSAEGRLSAGILVALPPGLGLWMWLTATDYVSLLFTESLGRVMLMAAGAGMVAGGLWMRKIIKLDY